MGIVMSNKRDNGGCNHNSASSSSSNILGYTITTRSGYVVDSFYKTEEVNKELKSFAIRTFTDTIIQQYEITLGSNLEDTYYALFIPYYDFFIYLITENSN